MTRYGLGSDTAVSRIGCVVTPMPGAAFIDRAPVDDKRTLPTRALSVCRARQANSVIFLVEMRGSAPTYISNSSFYILAYIPTYGVKTLHLPQATGFTATLVGGLILAIGCPLFGHWSDKISRPLIMVVACSLFVLTSYPAFWLMAGWPSLSNCIIAVCWLQLLKAGYSGVLPSLDVRAVPGRDPGDRRGPELQHRGVDLRRACAARCNLAHRADRRQPVAELLLDIHRGAQPRRADRDPMAQPPHDQSHFGALDGVSPHCQLQRPAKVEGTR